MKNEFLKKFTKEELIDLIELYSKNWLAMDGVWFQGIESKLGMDEAVRFDEKAWSHFTRIEAQKIKKFLKLPSNPGIEGLKSAMQLRFYANINKAEFIVNGNELIYRVLDCPDCVVEANCPKKAIIREDIIDKPWVDFYKCSGCLKCKILCSYNAICEITQPCH